MHKLRKPLIAGNWKMHKLITETREYVKDLKKRIENIEYVEVAIAPPFTVLFVAKANMGGSNLKLAAQDVFWEDEGAYTGEISPKFLWDLGCDYVIIGHSERRKYFGETDEDVNKKIKAALRHNIIPVVCVGETLEEREKGITFDVLKRQFSAFNDLSPDDMKKLVIAYEPVWAIGTGKTATPDTAQEAQSFIRNLIKEKFNEDVAQKVRILYGGSIKPDNIADLVAQPDIDGGLVGGASLNVDSFYKIIENTEKVYKEKCVA